MNDRPRAVQPGAAPESGPRILFLSGGSALRETSRVLKRYTHNSIHLITPFDSGGSSAALRQAFGMLGVGDLRNRLMALADESERGNPHVVELFSHRLNAEADTIELREELQHLVDGSHALMQAIRLPLRAVIREYLDQVARALPGDFELGDACIGNLILAGGFLRNGRDMNAVLAEFSQLVSVRGSVRPSAMVDAHLVALHAHGERTVGQHLLGKPRQVELGAILDLQLVADLQRDAATVQPVADGDSLALVKNADLICYPMGSFFGSVLANLLPRGMGRGIAGADCPKVFIPNAGSDPEMNGYSLGSAVEKLIEIVRRDAGDDVSARSVLDFVLIDRARARYDFELDVERVEASGVRVLDRRLVSDDPDRLDPQLLVEALLGLV